MTEEEDRQRVADFYKSASGKAYRKFGRHWELARYIREYLKPFSFFEGGGPEAEMLVQRMVQIVRSKNAKKAAATRKKNKQAREFKETSPMFPEFSDIKGRP